MSHDQSVNVSTKNEKFLFNAHKLSSRERRDLALKAMLKHRPVTVLAKESEVSRNFVYEQKDKATDALEKAFNQADKDDEVLFTIQVTRNFLHASVLSMALNCHSSERGIVQHFRDIYNHDISEGNVHNILADAAQKASIENKKVDLKPVKIAAHDEIFQGSVPILVGCDAEALFIYLLAKEQKRDMLTWGTNLLMCQEFGLNPDQAIADFGAGLRAGLKGVWPDLPCDADVFHVLMDLGKINFYLENRAVGTIAKVYGLKKDVLHLQKQAQSLSNEFKKICEKTKTKAKLVQLNIFEAAAPNARTLQDNPVEISSKISELESKLMTNQKQQAELSESLSQSSVTEKGIIKLVDIIEIVKDWFQRDILSVAGPDYNKRCELFDFAVKVLIDAEKDCPSKHVRKMITKLKNQRDDLLRFVLRNDKKLDAISKEFEIEIADLRELYELYGTPCESKHRWYQEQKLRKKIGAKFHLAEAKINAIIGETTRASSVIENINSRLRPYFFLRKSFGQESLDLLQFYLNHKTFLRSEHEERVGKSPAELLSGQPHPHWLEMLGFKRFKRTVEQTAVAQA
jgi:hypothetical protein